MPTPKEVQFFSRNWDEGWGWYEDHFAAADTALAVGEASPSYAEFVHFPDVPARIASRLPDVRLVYLVRHPVERIASQYIHNLARGFEEGPIEEAVVQRAGYIGMSQYATVIEGYLEHFPREQLLVLQSETMRDQTRETVRRVMDHIGVDADEPNQYIEREFYRADQKPRALKIAALRTRSDSKAQQMRVAIGGRLSPRWLDRRYLGLREMSPELAADLTEQLRPEVERLRAYLDPSFDGWGIA
jgi:hypothetical protein